MKSVCWKKTVRFFNLHGFTAGLYPCLGDFCYWNIWDRFMLRWKTLALLTYSTGQSPSWAANRFAVTQEIPRISRNPKVHYRTYNRPPPVSILGQPNPVHAPTSHLLEIHPNIIPQRAVVPMEEEEVSVCHKRVGVYFAPFWDYICCCKTPVSGPERVICSVLLEKQVVNLLVPQALYQLGTQQTFFCWQSFLYQLDAQNLNFNTCRMHGQQNIKIRFSFVSVRAIFCNRNIL